MNSSPTSSATNSPDLSSQLAIDVKGMADLRKSAQANSPQAMKQAATQFEAMFVNMMMKSMRDATGRPDRQFADQDVHVDAGPADQPEHRQERHRHRRYADAPAVQAWQRA